MTELFVVLFLLLFLLLTVRYSVAHRPVVGSRHKDPNAGEPPEPVKWKPDLSRVPTLPPIRRKHGKERDNLEIRNRRAS
jgi:hypothetical protein